MTAEQFFTGTTQAGRTLVLFYEHTRFDTFTDETGEPFDNPAETKITATLDGVPFDVQAVNWSRETATVRSDDLGTFTATSTDYAEDHSEALRRYLEHRPSTGWDVEVKAKAQEGGLTRYSVSISNGRLTERVDFLLSQQVMQTLARGAGAPTDEQVAHEIAQHVRSLRWPEIKEKAQAEHTTELRWIAHPS